VDVHGKKLHIDSTCNPELRPNAHFLRHHFKFCLKESLVGGDPEDDYSTQQTEDMIEGLTKGYFTFDHPDLQTELGQEIVRAYMAEHLELM
jgi:hypothetical protein